MKSKKAQITIAVTGVGAPLGQSIVRAAQASKRNYRIIALDIREEDRAIFPELTYCKCIHISSPRYAEEMEIILKNNKVDLIFLGSEREMLGILDFYEEIESCAGVKYALSNRRSLQIGMDKLETAELLRKASLPYPLTQELSGSWEEILAFAKRIGYPCIVKGRRAGQPYIIKSDDDLRYHFGNYKNAVIQEFLGNEHSSEYTVGIFYTPEFGIVNAYCMIRELKYGLTWRGRYEKNKDVEKICMKAVEALNPCGSINVQLRDHKGVPVIHEFNVRCSSTTVFRALSGWNEIDMAVDYFLFNKKPDVPLKIKPGVAVRYFQERWVGVADK